MNNKRKVPRILRGSRKRKRKDTAHLRTAAGMKNRNPQVASFKVPDYIDPMFHSRVIGTKAGTWTAFCVWKIPAVSSGEKCKRL